MFAPVKLLFDSRTSHRHQDGRNQKEDASHEGGAGVRDESFFPYFFQTCCSHFTFKGETQAGGPGGPAGVRRAGDHHAVLLVELLLSCGKSFHTQGELLLLRIEYNTETLPSEPSHSYSIVLPIGCDDRVSPASSCSSCSSVSLHHGGMCAYVPPSPC